MVQGSGLLPPDPDPDEEAAWLARPVDDEGAVVEYIELDPGPWSEFDDDEDDGSHEVTDEAHEWHDRLMFGDDG